MSEKKKKLKKIIIPFLLIAIIGVAIGIFFVSKNNNQNIQNETTEVSNVSFDAKENAAIADALSKNVCPEYDGNYKFKAIVDLDIDRDLTEEQRKNIYYLICGSKNKNNLIYYLQDEKKTNSANEIITLVNGKYSRYNNSTTTEKGFFYGNLDKSFVYQKSEDGTIIIDNQKYKNEIEISLTGYWIANKPETLTNAVYIKEKYYYGDQDSSYFTITYLYEMN